MANRESYPASQSPLTGDIDGSAGETVVTVVGFQGIPIEGSIPTDNSSWVYNAALSRWEWQPPENVDIILNDRVIMSDDFDFLCNCIGLEVLVNWPFGFSHQVFVNGTGVTGS